MKNILFIAPIPPPFNGQSLAASILFNGIKKDNVVTLVNTAKSSHKDGLSINNLNRIFEVIRILVDIYKKKSKSNIIYLQVSESLGGNLKDIITYLICIKRLDKMVIHLHGGSLGKLIFDKYNILKIINSYFIRRMRGIIVLGVSHKQIFESFVDSDKLYVVPNFAEDYLFTTDDQINRVFEDVKVIKILYLSSMISGKGYKALLDGYFMLEEKLRTRIQIDFAGSFDSEESKHEFLSVISSEKALNYHGVVNGFDKANLLTESHCFCLPTSYFEGQPISIIEAYASGCVVMTTKMGGIVDIFEDKVNGFTINSQSPDCVKRSLVEIIKNSDSLVEIAKHNLLLAKNNYRINNHLRLLSEILLN